MTGEKTVQAALHTRIGHSPPTPKIAVRKHRSIRYSYSYVTWIIDAPARASNAACGVAPRPGRGVETIVLAGDPSPPPAAGCFAARANPSVLKRPGGMGVEDEEEGEAGPVGVRLARRSTNIRLLRLRERITFRIQGLKRV